MRCVSLKSVAWTRPPASYKRFLARSLKPCSTLQRQIRHVEQNVFVKAHYEKKLRRLICFQQALPIHRHQLFVWCENTGFDISMQSQTLVLFGFNILSGGKSLVFCLKRFLV